jgi:hypothetical protein
MLGHLQNGIAKEQARAILPEGNTNSTLYMAGSLRSWIHYCELRRGSWNSKRTHDSGRSMLEYYSTTLSRCCRSIGVILLILTPGCVAVDDSWACIPVWIEDIIAISCAITEEEINK